MPKTSPIGSSNAAIWHKPSAIASILDSVNCKRSIKDSFTPFSFAASTSFVFSSNKYAFCRISSSATVMSPRFFASVPNLAPSLDADFARLPSISI